MNKVITIVIILWTIALAWTVIAIIKDIKKWINTIREEMNQDE